MTREDAIQIARDVARRTKRAQSIFREAGPPHERYAVAPFAPADALAGDWYALVQPSGAVLSASRLGGLGKTLGSEARKPVEARVTGAWWPATR